VRLSAVARLLRASFGVTRRRFSEGGKAATPYIFDAFRF
jgi:hypothetical protein